MAGCSRNDFLLHNLFFLTTLPAVLRQKKKILITLNAFEDEQFNYKAEVRCDPRVVPGP